jgi:SPW repeat
MPGICGERRPAIAAIVAFAEWEEWINVVFGLWVAASAWVVGFASRASAPPGPRDSWTGGQLLTSILLVYEGALSGERGAGGRTLAHK